VSVSPILGRESLTASATVDYFLSGSFIAATIFHGRKMEAEKFPIAGNCAFF
jgi:hypothetical protein